MGMIITFYSFKGGVGRTMALANIGCLLAQQGKRVLLLDFDLEAPGLQHYFASHQQTPPLTHGGVIGLLQAMTRPDFAEADMMNFVTTVSLPSSQLKVIFSGWGSDAYEQSVLGFDWRKFYCEQDGAARLEALRNKWRKDFDYVLIDSRTGITDTGGICTIFLPDLLLLIFTANAQSLDGVCLVAQRAQEGRQKLLYDRRRLPILPVPTRFDGRTEQEESERWLQRFEEELEPFYREWLPESISIREVLERTKIPHVPFFSFGEKLPVLTHTLTDPDLPGFYYQNIVQIIDKELSGRDMGSKIFISAVNTEFRSYRLRLARHLFALKDRPITIKIQEDFWQSGFTLLDNLADYIRDCDLVIHLVGATQGVCPSAEHLGTFYQHLGEAPPDPLPTWSYTQWEYHLARRFGKRVLVYLAADTAPRDCELFVVQDESAALLQRNHRDTLLASGELCKHFTGPLDLVREVFCDLDLNSEEAKPNNLPYASLGSLFKGREEFLVRISQALGEVNLNNQQGLKRVALTAPPRAAIHGLGGIGKTRAAIEYAHRHAGEYNALLFVQADSPGVLRQSLAALSGPLALKLEAQSARGIDAQLAAVLEWLHTHPGWLLILDHVDSEGAAREVESLLARLSGAGHVLVTSRISNWSVQVALLALDVLPADAAAAFLLERTEEKRRKAPDDAERVRALAMELGQLALALEQAGAYIAKRRLSFAQYLVEWRERQDRILEWFDDRLIQYPRSVAVTWRTSFDQLSALARRLLQLFAWFAPDPIPEWLIERGGGPFGVDVESSTKKRVSSAFEARDALEELESFSLITREDAEETFSVHRLVQGVIRRTLRDEPDQQTLRNALQWIRDAFEGDPQDIRSWPVLAPLAPHALAAAQHADAAGIDKPTAWLMSRLGMLYHFKARYAEAEPLLRRALAMNEQASGYDHPNVARALNNLASLLHATNRLAEAEPLLRRALAIDEQADGPDHPDIASSLNNLASLLHATNRLAEAEPLYRRALAINEQYYGPDQPQVAYSLNNLAVLLQATNRLAEAEPLYHRALAIDEQSYGSDHPQVANSLNNLADLLRDTNRLAEAEPLYHRALAIDEQSYGPDHPNVARDLNNLASLFHTTNRLAEAEPLYSRALAINEQSYSPEHPTIANRLNNLAGLLLATNRLAEAEPLMRRVLKTLLQFTPATGHPHPHLPIAINNYVGFLEKMGRTKEEIYADLRVMAPDLFEPNDTPGGVG